MKFYVCVRRGDRTGLPVGPFTTLEEADTWVTPTARWVSANLDPGSWFDVWGVAAKADEFPWIGTYNDQVGLTAARAASPCDTNPREATLSGVASCAHVWPPALDEHATCLHCHLPYAEYEVHV